MRASDVMSKGVVSVPATATIYEAAELLVNTRVSGMPVMDEDGTMVGIVSEGDLIGHIEAETEAEPGLMHEIADDAAAAAAYVRTHSRRVTDVMTRNVVTCQQDTPVEEIAALMLQHKVKRIVVMDDDNVVGMVSRINLVQALITRSNTSPQQKTPVAPPPRPLSDAELRRHVEEAVKAHRWSTARTEVTVNGGIVHLWGVVADEAVQRAYRVAAESVPGVKDVMDHTHVVRPLAHRRRLIW
ncbi:BON domain-containing protein [Enhydrobacter aerosaccus]|uniref:BON domain-containing protein n=1 Tax=Enhydrobacter aerosaccus TaxID=225324 RepID=A0A1T4TF24_9HYPH|nr:CBS domain-containing protein [Enhydrobacter aerosaccus]SKA38799.1 BON domain-containing protein [Enhydrobacter aerosaccus]